MVEVEGDRISTLAKPRLVNKVLIAKIVQKVASIPPRCLLGVSWPRSGFAVLPIELSGESCHEDPTNKPNWSKMSKKHGLQEDILSQNIY